MLASSWMLPPAAYVAVLLHHAPLAGQGTLCLC